MTISYVYNSEAYDTEADAQSAVNALALRLQNNPTDWMEAKEITSSESGWIVGPNTLTDAEILNPDSAKTYMCYSKFSGENAMPLTSIELTEKVAAFRTGYGNAAKVNTIYKIQDDRDADAIAAGENRDEVTITEITPTTDMSGYV